MANSELPAMLNRAGIRTLFFGLGAQRAGSTWMHEMLSNHPDIHAPDQQKELHYWSKWYFPYLETGAKIFERQRPTGVPRTLISAFFRKGGLDERRKKFVRGDFLEKWRTCLVQKDETHSLYGRVLLFGRRTESVIGEITPAYALLDKSGLMEMNAQHDDVRFIYILRDPVDRIKSALSYFSSRGTGVGSENVESSAAERLVEGTKGKNYLRHSQYEKTISVIESVIEPAKVHYCFFETMRQKREIERVCEFLSIDPTGINLPGRVNASKSSFAPLPDQLLNDVRRELSATYKFCSAKFTGLPDEWKASMNLLGSGPAAAL